MTKNQDQLLPHDIEAEEAVLGSVLIWDQALPVIQDKLAPADFYRERNGWVYAACIAAASQDLPVNQITVASELKAKNLLEDIGGPAYLSYLISRIPSPFGVEEYAEMVKGQAIHRRLIDVGSKIAGFGYLPMHYSEALARSKALLDSLLETCEVEGFVHVSELLDRKSEQVEHILTGFPKLDYLTQGGLPRQSLTILGAETSMGKTAFALALCRGVAKRDYQVGIVTLEMSKGQLLQRLLYSMAGVDSYNIRSTDYATIEAEEQRLREQGIWIYAPGGSDFKVIKATISAHKLKYGLDFLVYDYIGLERGPEAQNETLRRASIVRDLRLLATDEDLAVLAISQLSRPSAGAEVRKLSRFAWTAELEQHADMAMLLEPAEDVDPAFPARRTPVEGCVDLDVQKQRTGIGRVKIRFRYDKSTQRMVQV